MWGGLRQDIFVCLAKYHSFLLWHWPIHHDVDWIGGQEIKHLSPIQWGHNGRNSVSNHQPHDCLLNRLFRRRSKKRSKPRVTGLFVGNSPVTGEFPAKKGTITRKMFPFNDVIMRNIQPIPRGQSRSMDWLVLILKPKRRVNSLSLIMPYSLINWNNTDVG